MNGEDTNGQEMLNPRAVGRPAPRSGGGGRGGAVVARRGGVRRGGAVEAEVESEGRWRRFAWSPWGTKGPTPD
jgi:hypothetical protein